MSVQVPGLLGTCYCSSGTGHRLADGAGAIETEIHPLPCHFQTATGSSCLMAEGVGEAEAESKHTSLMCRLGDTPSCPGVPCCIKRTNRFAVLIESTIATEEHHTCSHMPTT